MEGRKEERRRIPLAVWRIGDRETAGKLWGSYKTTRGRSLGEAWKGRNCSEEYYIFAHRETRVFMGCCGVKVYNGVRGVYRVDAHVRECFEGDERGLVREMVRFALEGTPARVLLAGEGIEEPEELGFIHTEEKNYRGIILSKAEYILYPRGRE